MNRTAVVSGTTRPGCLQQGFSLVELLIAMTMGVVLIAGMLTVFSGNRRSSDLNSEMANMQENARFALNAMSMDARMGGFQGCPDINSAAARVMAQNAPAVGNIFATATTGSVVVNETTWSPPPPLTFALPITRTPIPGTHTLSLQYGGPEVEELAVPLVDENSSVEVASNPGNASVGDLMLISNCQFADLFRVTAIATSGVNTVFQHNAAANGNIVQSFTAPYGRNARDTPLVMRFHSEVYFVGDTGLTNDNGDRITALYRQSFPFNDNPVELVQGVENMRVRFGIRADSGQLRYMVPGAAAMNPGRVESIQIGLLMTSYDHIAAIDDEQTYILAGQAITPTNGVVDGTTHAQDKRFRLAFNTTIQVRNRRPRVTF